MNQAKHLAIAVFTYNQWHTNVEHCLWNDTALLPKNDLQLPQKSVLCPNIWLGRSVLHFILYFFSVLLTVLTEGWTKLHRSVSWFPLWPNEGWWDGWECDTFLGI